MKTHPIASPQEWEAARQQLLAKEKGLTRDRDALAAERRRIPHPNLSKIHWRAHLATWPVPASCPGNSSPPNIPHPRSEPDCEEDRLAQDNIQ